MSPCTAKASSMMGVLALLLAASPAQSAERLGKLVLEMGDNGTKSLSWNGKVLTGSCPINVHNEVRAIGADGSRVRKQVNYGSYELIEGVRP